MEKEIFGLTLIKTEAYFKASLSPIIFFLNNLTNFFMHYIL